MWYRENINNDTFPGAVSDRERHSNAGSDSNLQSLRNTEKVAGMLEHHLVRKGVNVQAMELARRDLFNDKDRLADFLDRALLPHDVLIIGGPTYAGICIIP